MMAGHHYTADQQPGTIGSDASPGRGAPGTHVHGRAETRREPIARMGMEVFYRKQVGRNKCPDHDVCPYLLRGLNLNLANQVWALDTTYNTMAKGFVSLPAVVDWASRKVLPRQSRSRWRPVMPLRCCTRRSRSMTKQRL